MSLLEARGLVFSNHSFVSHLWSPPALHLNSPAPSAGTADVERTWRVMYLNICSATAAWQLSGSSVEGLPSTTARSLLDSWERNLLPFGVRAIRQDSLSYVLALPRPLDLANAEFDTGVGWYIRQQAWLLM
jgi:hypothetical protein